MDVKRDDILQKRPIILRSLLIVATPHQTFICVHNDDLPMCVCMCVCVCLFVCVCAFVCVCGHNDDLPRHPHPTPHSTKCFIRTYTRTHTRTHTQTHTHTQYDPRY